MSSFSSVEEKRLVCDDRVRRLILKSGPGVACSGFRGGGLSASRFSGSPVSVVVARATDIRVAWQGSWRAERILVELVEVVFQDRLDAAV